MRKSFLFLLCNLFLAFFINISLADNIWKLASYDNISSIKFSSDWKSNSYIATENWKNFIVKDWIKIWKSYTKIYDFAYAKDSQDIYYERWEDCFMSLQVKFCSSRFFVKNWIEEKKYKIGTEAATSTIINSPKNNWFIFKLLEWDKTTLIKDWIEITSWHNIIIPPIYSPDWNSYIYWYKDNKDWPTTLIKDWIELWKYDSVFPLIKYSNDSKHYLFLVITKDKKNFVVKDWINWKSYEYIDYENLDFSPNWESFAYLSRIEWIRYMVKDSVELWKSSMWWTWWKDSGDRDGSPEVAFAYSPDSKSFSYIWFEEKSPWIYERYIIKDWIKLLKNTFTNKDWDTLVNKFSFIYSLRYINNTDIVYKTNLENTSKLNTYWIDKWKPEIKPVLIKNDEIVDALDLSNPICSDDLKDCLYITYTEDWKSSIVKNKNEILWPYESVNIIKYWNEWKNLSYIAKEQGLYYFYTNWKRWTWYNNIYDVKFSPDSKSFSYIAWKWIPDWYDCDWKINPNCTKKVRRNVKDDFEKSIIVKDWIEINWNKYFNSFWIKYFTYTPDSKDIMYVLNTSIPKYITEGKIPWWKLYAPLIQKNKKVIIIQINNNNFSKEINETKEYLEKSWYKAYIKKIDNLLWKNKSNLNNLELLKDKLNRANSDNYILKYLKYLVYERLDQIYKSNK